jgi:hypothetical protein
MLDVRDSMEGAEVSAPSNNFRHALEVSEALPEFSRKEAEPVVTG